MGKPDGGKDAEPDAEPDAGPDAGAPPGLGATVTASGVTFRVWAPHATSAAVVGDFPAGSAPMALDDEGFYSAAVEGAKAGTSYHFHFEGPSGPIDRIDPYCREVVPGEADCLVIDPAAYVWKSAPLARPARNAAVVYEMHIGGFSVAPGASQGTLASAKDKLAELAELGVNVVELMPVQAYGGNAAGWGYNPHLYFAPKPTYGSAADLRAFVDEAHAQGIAVWLDTVINHYSNSGKAPLACYDGECPNGTKGIYFFPPGPYAMTPWGPRPDYTAPEVAAMLDATVPWWLGENRGDGFRWDSVSNIRAIDGQGETPGGKALLVALNDHAHQAGALSVAEDLKGWDMITKPASAGGFGFDAQWDGFGYNVNGVLVPFSDDGRSLDPIQGALKGTYAGDAFARLLFTENHDTVGNGGSRLPSAIDPQNPQSFAARRRSMLAATLLITSPGVPMLFMGQESLAFGSFTDPPTPLASTLPAGSDKIRAFYKDLIALRRNLGGGTGGLMDDKVDILHREDTNKVIAYRRSGPSGEDVIVVLNLRNKGYTRYDIGAPSPGTWKIRLDTDWLAYGNDFGGGQTGTVDTLPIQKDGKPDTLPVKLGKYAAVIFSR